MPECGSQCWLCDLPIRFDTYKGCTHGCKYCFVMRKKDLTDIEKGETKESLLNFIKGKRRQTTSFVDWDIPIHWGGMSDPFQPVEKSLRYSYDALEVFRETNYPYVVSTKGKLIGDEEYIDIIKYTNCVVQISLVDDKFDILEPGCPTFQERLDIIKRISKKFQRVVVRIQPYLHELYDDIYENLDKYADAGVYGVIVEGMKFVKKKRGLVKVGSDWTYPYDIIKNDIIKLREHSHELGLKFYSGENRTRKYGDDLCCCGIDGLKGFIPNRYNLNHILNGDKNEATEAMRKKGSGFVFRAIGQNSIVGERVKKTSFEEELSILYSQKRGFVNDVLGVGKD